jgi:hypothetical protein
VDNMIKRFAVYSAYYSSVDGGNHKAKSTLSF